LQLGLGAGYFPDYTGSTSSTTQLVPLISGKWCTERWGSVELETASGTTNATLTWRFLERESWSLGLQAGLRDGRDDSDAGALRINSGSPRLKGLNPISEAIDFGAQATAELGDLGTLYLRARTAGGNGGWLVETALYTEVKLGPRLGIALLPGLAWGDAAYLQRYFGVTAAESTRSGFAAYRPTAGLVGASLELAAEYGLSRHWSLIVDVGYTRLLGDAAASPIVSSANQWTSFATLAYRF
jgi:outer membrane scaffolding protein for murein synthesis (MipA/OmpV family)